MENIFTAVFAIEMICKLYWERMKYFEDHWNILDFGLSWMAILDVWILAHFQGALSSFSSIRIVRLLRMARMLRVLRIKKELVVIVEGLWASMKSMAWIGVLLLVIIYTFAIFCKGIIEYEKYEGLEEFDARLYFGTVAGSMMTLFNMCLLDEWGFILRPIADEQPYMIPFFLSYLMLVTLGVLNLIIGVIAERTMEAGTDLKVAEEGMIKRAKMKAIIQMTDDIFENDTDGGLTVEELETALGSSPELGETLRSCDLPRGFVLGDLHLMFDQEYGSSVNKDEFINGMFRLVFNNEKQDALCLMLTIAEVKREVKDGLVQLLEEMKGHMNEATSGLPRADQDAGQRTKQDWDSRTAEALTPRMADLPASALCAAVESFSARAKADPGLACAPPPPAVDAPPVPAAGGAGSRRWDARSRRPEEPEVAGDAYDMEAYEALGPEHAELCRHLDTSVRVCAAQLRSDLTAQHSDLVLTLKATLSQSLADKAATGPSLVEVPVKQSSCVGGALNGVSQRGVARVRAVDFVMEPDPDGRSARAPSCGCLPSAANLARASPSDAPRRV